MDYLQKRVTPHVLETAAYPSPWLLLFDVCHARRQLEFLFVLWPRRLDGLLLAKEKVEEKRRRET